MSRTDWFIGLNDNARKFLDENCIKLKRVTYDENGKVLREDEILKSEEGNKYCWHSMFGTTHPLNVYFLKDGSKVYEKVQLDPWSSGPNIFTALVDENDNWIKETMWDEDEVLRDL